MDSNCAAVVQIEREAECVSTTVEVMRESDRVVRLRFEGVVLDVVSVDEGRKR